MAGLSNFLELAFSGPVLPATILILLLIAYSVLVLCGLVDSGFEPPDIGGGDAALDIGDTAGIGAISVRLLNLDLIPIFVWVSVFGFCWWVISLVLWGWLDSSRYEPTLIPSLLLAGRNIVIAVIATKFVTMPMRSWFERGRAYNISDLLGETCEIQTGEANEHFGRAKFKTDGAPLLLNVRTAGETLVKGQSAKIVDFDAVKRIYIVESIEATE